MRKSSFINDVALIFGTKENLSTALILKAMCYYITSVQQQLMSSKWRTDLCICFFMFQVEAFQGRQHFIISRLQLNLVNKFFLLSQFYHLFAFLCFFFIFGTIFSPLVGITYHKRNHDVLIVKYKESRWPLVRCSRPVWKNVQNVNSEKNNKFFFI